MPEATRSPAFDEPQHHWEQEPLPDTLAELAETGGGAPRRRHTVRAIAQASRPAQETLLAEVSLGAWAVSYLLDLVALLAKNERLARQSFSSMLFGWITAMPATLTGLMERGELASGEQAQSAALQRGLLHLGGWLLYGTNLAARGQRGGRVGLLPFGLSTLGLLLFAGRLRRIPSRAK